MDVIQRQTLSAAGGPGGRHRLPPEQSLVTIKIKAVVQAARRLLAKKQTLCAASLTSFRGTSWTQRRVTGGASLPEQSLGGRHRLPPEQSLVTIKIQAVVQAARRLLPKWQTLCAASLTSLCTPDYRQVSTLQ